jgi:hybrid cluster-associated redox disulfide protein
MCYNCGDDFNYSEVIIMTIDKKTVIGDILDAYPETAEFFFEIGMHCLGCPHSRGESVEEACYVHGTDADELIAKINASIQE